MKVRKHVYISGIVQGVFFRANTKRVADSLGIKGFVRNLSDGRVEAVFEGEEKDIEKILNWCRKGPPAARVDKVDVIDEQYTGEFKNFTIKYW